MAIAQRGLLSSRTFSRLSTRLEALTSFVETRYQWRERFHPIRDGSVVSEVFSRGGLTGRVSDWQRYGTRDGWWRRTFLALRCVRGTAWVSRGQRNRCRWRWCISLITVMEDWIVEGGFARLEVVAGGVVFFSIPEMVLKAD